MGQTRLTLPLVTPPLRDVVAISIGSRIRRSRQADAWSLGHHCCTSVPLFSGCSSVLRIPFSTSDPTYAATAPFYVA